MLLLLLFSCAMLNVFCEWTKDDLLFVLLRSLDGLVFPKPTATLTSCVSCSNCQDVYDGTDTNVSCSYTVANADSCQKTRIQLPGTTYVLKTCAKSCQAQSIIAGPVRYDVTCCSTDNCNGAVSAHSQSILTFITGLSIVGWQRWNTDVR